MQFIKFFLILIGFIFIQPVNTYADEMDDELNQYDFTKIDEETDGEFDFKSVLKEIIKGDFSKGMENFSDNVRMVLFTELENEKGVLIKLIIIGLLSALFSNISGHMLNGNISEAGFFVAYLAFISVMLSGFNLVMGIVKATLTKLIALMQSITPVYILSVGFVTGESSATAFYGVFAIVITLIQKMFQSFVIPMIYINTIIGIINNLACEKLFNKASELIETVINWTLKTMMAFVIGLNIVRGLINPVVDSLQVGMLYKTLRMIPGIGNSLNSVSTVLLASGTLIKNGIGMTSMLAILVICFIPIVKTAIISICYKGVGAVLEPVSDKRIVNSVNSVHTNIALLLKTLLYAIIFFVLTIAIICATTNYK